MATKKEPRKFSVAAAAGGESELTPESEARFMSETINWQRSALLMEARILNVDDEKAYSEEEKWEIVKNGISASVLARHQIRRELSNALPEDELRTSYLAMANLHAAAGDGIIAMIWLIQQLTKAQANAPAEVRRELAKLSAAARWENDPAAKAMREVRIEWNKWQAGQERFKSDAAFAREMIQRYPEITSEGSIKNAVSRWRKE